MKTQRAYSNRILRTAVIVACVLAPVLGIAIEPSLNELLLQAAKNGDLEQVKALLAQGGDLNVKVDGKPVLIWAVDPRNLIRFRPMLKEAYWKAYMRSVNLDLVKFLVEQGADVNARDFLVNTALMYAVQSEAFPIVKFLVDQGANVNAVEATRDYAVAHGPLALGDFNRLDQTTLMLAAESVNVEIMKFLIGKGAEINAKDYSGFAALMRAAQLGRPGVTKLLITKGADLNVKDKDGRTPLSYASANRETAVVKYLKAHGAKWFRFPLSA